MIFKDYDYVDENCFLDNGSNAVNAFSIRKMTCQIIQRPRLLFLAYRICSHLFFFGCQCTGNNGCSCHDGKCDQIGRIIN